MRGRQQSNLVPVCDQRLPPMMRRRARLHRHHARQLGEEPDQLAAREFARHNDLTLRVYCVNLKHPLRQIETNPRDCRQFRIDLPMDGFPSDRVLTNDHLGTLMPFHSPRT
jgi:hypothetical protein